MSSHRRQSPHKPLCLRRGHKLPESGVKDRRCTVLLTAGGALSGAALSVVLSAGSAAHAAEPAIGALRIVRQVQVTRGVAAAGATPASFVAANDHEGVFAGEGIRTLKRSQAEVDFRDRSVLRVNERTDLVVQDSASLRNIQLNGGVVWVRVAKGVRTQVETPSATAVARGTVFTVAVLPNGGGTQLTVLEGVVDFLVGGKEVSVHPGETISVDAKGNFPDVATKLPVSQLPIEYGGSVTGWWTTLGDNVGVVTTPGSDSLIDLRSSPVNETIQALSAAALTNTSNGPTNSGYFLQTTAEQQTFFSNVNSAVRTDWSEYVQNPTAFLASTAAAQPISTLELTSAQIAALQSLPVKVTTVGDAVQVYNANAASAGITVNFDKARPTRSAYLPGALTVTPNFDYRLIDRNETSLAILGVGAVAALIADSSKLGSVSLPTLSGQAFGFLNDPDILGGRARLDGSVGQTRYHLEGDVLRLLTGDNVKTYSKPDSVFYVEHPVGDSINVFAGRRRFYEGPVFQDEVGSQLIADRYSSAGASYKAGEFSLMGAYLYDSNPDAAGAQSGALGSAYFHRAGGVYGVHYLHVAGLIGGGNGYSGSVSYPLVKNTLDFYGEVGSGPDKANIDTVGAYFPGLYQKTDTDFFLEFGYREGTGHAVSLIGSRDMGKFFNLRAYMSFLGSNDVKAGLIGIFKFSTK